MIEKKKNFKKVSMIVFTMFIFATFLAFVVGFTESDNQKNYQMKLYINEVIATMDNPEIVNVGNKNYFNKEKNEIKALKADTSWINLNLKMNKTKDNKNVDRFEANGTLRLSDKTYPFKAIGTLDNIILSDNNNLCYGSLRGEITTDKGSSNLVLGMEFIPNSDKCHVSLSVGQLDSIGMALLDFGDLFIDKNLNNQIEEQ
ncbi:MAG: hypothetical protein WBL93_05280, partial [Lutisporaceae bacterium]